MSTKLSNTRIMAGATSYPLEFGQECYYCVNGEGKELDPIKEGDQEG